MDKTRNTRRRISDFEVFTGARVKPGEKFVKLAKNGGFLFSVGLVKEEQLDKYSHCVLAYDKKTRAILFSFTNDEQIDEAVKLTYREKMKNVSMQVKSFYTTFGLDPSELVNRYKLERVNVPKRGEWSAIFLDEPITRLS